MTQILKIRTINRDGDEPTEVEVPVATPGYLTTEFWAMIGGVLINLITVLAAIGYVSATDANELTSALTTMFGALQALVVNGLVIWKYIQSRTTVKAEAVRMQLQLTAMSMQMQSNRAIEQMRIAAGNTTK